MLGACLITAGRNSEILSFNEAVADTLSSLMTMTVIALILPTALHLSIHKDKEEKITSFSRATTTLLLLTYIAYLYFQMRTHKHLFIEQPRDDNSINGPSGDQGGYQNGEGSEHEDDGTTAHEQHEDEALSALGIGKAVTILVVSALAIGKCTHHMIESLDQTATSAHVTDTFIATIILPIASNAPEFSTVYGAARRKQLDFAISMIVGSILQIALLVLPILVLVGFFTGQGMNLYFEPSQTCILFLATLAVNQVLRDGKYTFLASATSTIGLCGETPELLRNCQKSLD